MALVRTALTGPAVTSFNSLANSLVAVASSAAITVGTTTNIADHEIMVTLTGPTNQASASSSTVVNLFAYTSIDGTTWGGSNTTNELIDGTDKAITWSANGYQAVYLGSIKLTTITTVTSIIYRKRFSLAMAFGGILPAKYVIVAQNQAGAALAASGHSIAVNELSYS